MTTIDSLEQQVTNYAKTIGIKDDIWAKFMVILAELKEHNEFMYAHSLRVGLYVLGLAKSESQPDLHFALFAGCGHDIGKCEVANELLDSKNLQPAEFEVIKLHAVEGFARLKNEFLFTAFVAGLHHKYKPGGYGIELNEVSPFKLNPKVKSKIESMARLVMLADFFDALTTRNNNKGLIDNPHDPLQQQVVMAKFFNDQPERIEWLIGNRLLLKKPE